MVKLLTYFFKNINHKNTAMRREEWHPDAPFLLGDGTGQGVDAAWVIGRAGQVAA